MDSDETKVSPQHPQDVLLQLKYLGSLRRVARGVAHGYNNIFTGLGGQISLLQREVSGINDAISRKNTLINELLRRGIEQTQTLSDLTQGPNPDHCIQVPHILAEKAIDLLHCVSRVHHFSMIDLKNEHQKFVCNARDILLILLYLGENCIDATPEGGTVFLDLLYALSGDDKQHPSVAFCFRRDHGPGLPDRINGLLGTPFVTTRDDSPERGFGLYAADILARRNNGQLVHSRNGEDVTETCVRFPLMAEERSHDPRGDMAGDPQENCNFEPEKQCFLILDDDEGMRALLLAWLRRRGHIVFCVKSCEEAIDEYTLLHETITIVLMDIGLRDASGYECYRKMMNINPKVKVIFMSGQKARIPENLVTNTVFLQKPFAINQMEKAVRDVQLHNENS